jgi:hypothetical protein
MATRDTPRQLTVNFGNLSDAHIAANLSRAKRVQVRQRSAPSFGSETLLTGAISAATAVSPSRTGVLPSMVSLLTPPVPTLRQVMSPLLTVLRTGTDFTVTDGAVASAGAGITAGLGGGVYLWVRRPRPELGLYGSISVGAMTNIGFGAGACVSLLFGAAPSVLAGDCIALEADIGIDVVTVSGLIYLSAPTVTSVWPPVVTPGWTPQVIGIGFQLTAGMSVLPANYAVSASRTWIRPVI